jgi:hypothetical protein
MTLEKMIELKKRADDIYTNSGDDTGFTDQEYDDLVNEIKKKDPNYKKNIGDEIRGDDNRITLPLWMGSVNTYKSQDEKEIIKKRNLTVYLHCMMR